jgi:hypothetical protein
LRLPSIGRRAIRWGGDFPPTFFRAYPEFTFAATDQRKSARALNFASYSEMTTRYQINDFGVKSA